MIEVLVTALILGTAILALMSMQSSAIKFSSSAYLRSQANTIAYDIMDRVRFSSPVAGAVVEVPQADIEEIASKLPNGAIDMNCVGRECTLTVSWLEPLEGPSETSDGTASITTVTRI